MIHDNSRMFCVATFSLFIDEFGFNWIDFYIRKKKKPFPFSIDVSEEARKNIN